MSPFEEPHLSHSENSWLGWFRNGILNADMDESGARSTLHYLIDLNVLVFEENGLLKLYGIGRARSNNKVKKSLIKTLHEKSTTKNGFALVYLISDLSKNELPSLKYEGPSLQVKRENIFGKGFSKKNKHSSDLSNLQIVKKWGSELRPFLDLEQQTISRLKGIYTSKEDAQRLYSYILQKTRKKSPAKEWEQISRKRHR